MTKLHVLEVPPSNYGGFSGGYRNFDIRKNDRGYKMNDFVVLREFTKEGSYTGRMFLGRINFVEDDHEGLASGYCILRYSRCEKDEFPNIAITIKEEKHANNT